MCHAFPQNPLLLDSGNDILCEDKPRRASQPFSSRAPLCFLRLDSRDAEVETPVHSGRHCSPGRCFLCTLDALFGVAFDMAGRTSSLSLRLAALLCWLLHHELHADVGICSEDAT